MKNFFCYFFSWTNISDCAPNELFSNKFRCYRTLQGMFSISSTPSIFLFLSSIFLGTLLQTTPSSIRRVQKCGIINYYYRSDVMISLGCLFSEKGIFDWQTLPKNSGRRRLGESKFDLYLIFFLISYKKQNFSYNANQNIFSDFSEIQ